MYIESSGYPFRRLAALDYIPHEIRAFEDWFSVLGKLFGSVWKQMSETILGHCPGRVCGVS